MPDLNFKIEKAEPVAHAATPLLSFTLRLDDAATPARLIHSVALRCQIRIDPARRRYSAGEEDQLLDLFGEPARWGQTLRSMLWVHVSVNVPSFTGSALAELPVPCSQDFNLGAAKYFYALQDGEVPLTFLFSGTVFHQSEDDALHVEPISWEKEATFRLPVSTWKRMIDLYYPNTAWLCLRKDAFDPLYRFKSRRGLPTWEAAIERLLEEAGANEEDAQPEVCP